MKKIKNPSKKYSDHFLLETVDLQGFLEFTVQKNIQKIEALIIKSLWISLWTSRIRSTYYQVNHKLYNKLPSIIYDMYYTINTRKELSF